MFRPPLPYSNSKKYRIMASKHSPMLTSPSTWYHLSWLHTAIFLVISTIFYTTMVSCSRIDIPYNKHCAWIVPESTNSSWCSSTHHHPFCSKPRWVLPWWGRNIESSKLILSKKLIYCDNTVKTLIMYNIYHSIRTPCLLNSMHTYMKVRLAVTRKKSVLQSTKINIFLHLWIKWLHLRAYCNHHHRSCLCNTLWQWQIQKLTKAPLLALPIQ
jgi:hypothetical protein